MNKIGHTVPETCPTLENMRAAGLGKSFEVTRYYFRIAYVKRYSLMQLSVKIKQKWVEYRRRYTNNFIECHSNRIYLLLFEKIDRLSLISCLKTIFTIHWKFFAKFLSGYDEVAEIMPVPVRTNARTANLGAATRRLLCNVEDSDRRGSQRDLNIISQAPRLMPATVPDVY